MRPRITPEQCGQREQEQQRDQGRQEERGSEQTGPLRKRAHTYHRQTAQGGEGRQGRTSLDERQAQKQQDHSDQPCFPTDEAVQEQLFIPARLSCGIL